MSPWCSGLSTTSSPPASGEATGFPTAGEDGGHHDRVCGLTVEPLSVITNALRLRSIEPQIARREVTMTTDITHPPPDGAAARGETRRDFLYIVTGTMGAVGVAAAIWPLLDSMNPAADAIAASSIEVDIAPIALGQRVTVKWRGKPVFIVHRSADDIARAKADDNNPDLIDPATDSERVQRAEWLIVIGICTHLGCIPLGQKPEQPRGNWGGWFCACHGSIYDMAGRVRKGPAPLNLYLPDYRFLTDERVRIG
jgi:ubiquinol-cytochrome c reductase iron-sulfur subunit